MPAAAQGGTTAHSAGLHCGVVVSHSKAAVACGVGMAWWGLMHSLVQQQMRVCCNKYMACCEVRVVL